MNQINQNEIGNEIREKLFTIIELKNNKKMIISKHFNLTFTLEQQLEQSTFSIYITFGNNIKDMMNKCSGLQNIEIIEENEKKIFKFSVKKGLIEEVIPQIFKQIIQFLHTISLSKYFNDKIISFNENKLIFSKFTLEIKSTNMKLVEFEIKLNEQYNYLSNCLKFEYFNEENIITHDTFSMIKKLKIQQLHQLSIQIKTFEFLLDKILPIIKQINTCCIKILIYDFLSVHLLLGFEGPDNQTKGFSMILSFYLLQNNKIDFKCKLNRKSIQIKTIKLIEETIKQFPHNFIINDFEKYFKLGIYLYHCLTLTEYVFKPYSNEIEDKIISFNCEGDLFFKTQIPLEYNKDENKMIIELKRTAVTLPIIHYFNFKFSNCLKSFNLNEAKILYTTILQKIPNSPNHKASLLNQLNNIKNLINLCWSQLNFNNPNFINKNIYFDINLAQENFSTNLKLFVYMNEEYLILKKHILEFKFKVRTKKVQSPRIEGFEP